MLNLKKTISTVLFIYVFTAMLFWGVSNLNADTVGTDTTTSLTAKGGHGGHHGGHHGHHSHHHHHSHHGHHHNDHHNHHARDFHHGYWNGGGDWGANPGYYSDPNYYYSPTTVPSVQYEPGPTIYEPTAPTIVPAPVVPGTAIQPQTKNINVTIPPK